METRQEPQKWDHLQDLVLILPMRNGNWNKINQKTEFTLDGSYPTYEEWKPDDVSVLNEMFEVLILPMRNGN